MSDSIDQSHRVLVRVGTQFVVGDDLTGNGVPAPAWIPQLQRLALVVSPGYQRPAHTLLEDNRLGDLPSRVGGRHA